MFSLDTESGFRDVVLISATYGLGENIVQGDVDPDDFYVFKPTLARGCREILRRELGSKKLKLVYAAGPAASFAAGNSTRNVDTTAEEQRALLPQRRRGAAPCRLCAGDRAAFQRARRARHADGHGVGQGWHSTASCICCRRGPETVASQKATHLIDEYSLKGSGPVLISGPGDRQPHRHRPGTRDPSAAQMGEFVSGEVLVTDNTTPDWEPIMKRAAAIVTNRGGRTCHAAIVARELGIPALVGTGTATEVLHTGDQLTVACSGGETGHVYEGSIPFDIQHLDVSGLPKTRTQIMLILGNPEIAFQSSFLPNDGVGLARMEFIVTEYMQGASDGAAASGKDRWTQRSASALLRLTRNYARPADFFVERLSEGIATIAAAFYPKPVILRMSDFKTNEYASLLGGRWFEPVEANPMLGFRGAARYSHPAYREGFGLECAAVRARARADGPEEPQDHDPVLPARAGGGAHARDAARVRPGARARRARGLRDVRDPEQRAADRCVRTPVRRILDRIERPDAADAGRGPGLGAGGVRFRRARCRREAAAAPGGGRLPTQSSALRDLRPGAVRLSGEWPNSWCGSGSTRSASIRIQSSPPCAASRRWRAASATRPSSRWSATTENAPPRPATAGRRPLSANSSGRRCSVQSAAAPGPGQRRCRRGSRPASRCRSARCWPAPHR